MGQGCDWETTWVGQESTCDSAWMGQDMNMTRRKWDRTCMEQGVNGAGSEWDRTWMGQNVNGTWRRWDKTWMGQDVNGTRREWDNTWIWHGTGRKWDRKWIGLSMHKGMGTQDTFLVKQATFKAALKFWQILTGQEWTLRTGIWVKRVWIEPNPMGRPDSLSAEHSSGTNDHGTYRQLNRSNSDQYVRAVMGFESETHWLTNPRQ